MTARYKIHKFRDKWNDGYFKPSFTDPNRVERQIVKKEISEEVLEADKSHVSRNENQDAFEIEMQNAIECYRKELADPNYKCKCFED